MGILDTANSILAFDFIERVNTKDKLNIAGFTTFGLANSSMQFTTVVSSKLVESKTLSTENMTLEPLMITFTGDVADIFIENKIDSYLDSVSNIVTVVNPYLPLRTQSTTDKIFKLTDTVQNASNFIASAIGDTKTILSEFGDKTKSKSPQDSFIETLINLHTSKSLVDLEFNNKTYKRMRIISNTITTNNESKKISFNIIAKQIIEPKKTSTAKVSNGVKDMTTKTVDKGQQKPDRTSLLYKLVGVIERTL